MWQVVGHRAALDLLDRSLEGGRLAHAYLFSGPPHVGKMTLALDLARAANCQSAPVPCQSCHSCRRISTGAHADVRVVGLAEDEKGREGRLRKEISIEQVRTLQHDAQLLPYEGRYRVFIVDGVERMSDPAANALLKTLEEPPPHVVLLMLTADDRLLLPTVVSRCQRVELRPLRIPECESALVSRWGAEPARAHLLARLSEGRLGWAVQALTDDRVLPQRGERLRALGDLLRAGRVERFAYASDLANQFARDRASVQEVLSLWAAWWRDLLLVRSGCGHLVANLDQAEVLEGQSARLTLGQVRGFLESLQETLGQLEGNVNPRLALEALMLRLPHY